MRQLIQQLDRMAARITIATLEGEEGTGRSLAAAALHSAGPAATGRFVPCLATHFFTPSRDGEQRQRQPEWSESALRQAHGGMLFLDRVHELSQLQQEHLVDFLRWFDNRRSRGRSDASTDGDLRISPQLTLPAQVIFSSSLPLRNPATGFRVDLASRLGAVRFRLPPLIERREDIPLLAQIFVQRFARTYGKPIRGLGPGTIAPLLRHSWPGNVRELEETITAAALQTESQWIRPIDLPQLNPVGRRHSLGGSRPDPENKAEPILNLDHAIRNHVARVLEAMRGNKLRAARALGISRSTLYRILAESEGDSY